jgi:hypothetical protein
MEVKALRTALRDPQAAAADAPQEAAAAPGAAGRIGPAPGGLVQEPGPPHLERV